MTWTEQFTYSNGELYWKNCKAYNVKDGDIVGCNHHSGYKVATYMGRQYRVHQLIFAYHYGYIPKQIDHIDRNKSNNKIENLRECTTTENIRNRGKMKSNKTGITGVRLHKPSGKYRAQIGHNGKQIDLGQFENITDAIEARKKGEQKYGY